MPIIKVSLAFAKGTDFSVEKLAGILLVSLYGNANFPTPPFASTVLATARTEFLDAIDAQENGGKAATVVKNNKKEALIAHASTRRLCGDCQRQRLGQAVYQRL